MRGSGKACGKGDPHGSFTAPGGSANGGNEHASNAGRRCPNARLSKPVLTGADAPTRWSAAQGNDGQISQQADAGRTHGRIVAAGDAAEVEVEAMELYPLTSWRAPRVERRQDDRKAPDRWPNPRRRCSPGDADSGNSSSSRWRIFGVPPEAGPSFAALGSLPGQLFLTGRHWRNSSSESPDAKRWHTNAKFRSGACIGPAPSFHRIMHKSTGTMGSKAECSGSRVPRGRARIDTIKSCPGPHSCLSQLKVALSADDVV